MKPRWFCSAAAQQNTHVWWHTAVWYVPKKQRIFCPRWAHTRHHCTVSQVQWLWYWLYVGKFVIFPSIWWYLAVESSLSWLKREGRDDDLLEFRSAFCCWLVKKIVFCCLILRRLWVRIGLPYWPIFIDDEDLDFVFAAISYYPSDEFGLLG